MSATIGNTSKTENGANSLSAPPSDSDSPATRRQALSAAPDAHPKGPRDYRTITGKLSDHVAAYGLAEDAVNVAKAALDLAEREPKDNRDDAAVLALQDAYNGSLDARDLALAWVMCTPAYSVFDLGQQAIALAHAYYEDGIGRPVVEPMSFDMDDAVQALLMNVTTLSAHERRIRTALADVSREAWDNSVTDYWRAKHEADEADRIVSRVSEAVKHRAPLPDSLVVGERRLPRYASLDAIRKDGELSWEQMIELSQAYSSWHAMLEAEKVSLDYDAAHEQYDKACSVLSEAISTVVETPAPDIAALAFKSALLIDNEEVGASESPEAFQALLYCADPVVTGLARMHQDILRLNGSPNDIADVQEWDALAWVNEFEAHPGWEIDYQFLSPTYYPAETCRTWGPGAAPAEAKAMFGELAYWQKRAIADVWPERPSRKHLSETISLVRDWIEADLINGVGEDQIDREATLASAATSLGLPEVHIPVARDNLERHGWSRREYLAKHPEAGASLHCSPMRERGEVQ